jgi:DNA-binding transcriptional LysR family regulator
LEVRHLQAFLAVADEGTFSRAAERLGYTQSAVSQQVRALEHMVGAELFDRPGGPRPVTLTPAGTALEGHARAVVGRVVDAAAELRAVCAGETGTLRVGCIQSVGHYILPELMSRFRATHPKVQVRLSESQDPNPLLDQVADGGLDMMFVPLPGSGGSVSPQFALDKSFSTQLIMDDPYVFLVPATSPEAELRSISLEEIVRLPLVGYRSNWCRSIVANRLAPVGGLPEVVFETDDNATMQGLVGAGEAYAFVSRLSIVPTDVDTVVVPIDPPVEPRRMSVLTVAGRTPPPALAPFIETAEKVCAGLFAG